MIVGACGFSWSGSSAVTDLLKEFPDFQVYDRIEFLLAYHPDGLADLDHHLNYSCAKFLSSNVAIPRFRWLANYLLDRPTKGKIKDLTDCYINELVQTEWKGLAQGQILVHNKFLFSRIGKGIMYKLFRRLPPNLCKSLNLYPISQIEFSICPESFQEKTQYYTDQIFEAIGLDSNKNIVLDQPFPGNNPYPFLKYYRNSRAIIVDRDPRELYLLAKHFYPKTSYQVPHDNVDDFISYYKHMHKTILGDKLNNVLYIRFENLVYEYDRTVSEIMKFLDLKVHKSPRSCFVPEKSMVNTRLYQKCHLYDDDIKKIETELQEYIYPFEQYMHLYSKQDKSIQMFDDNPLSR